MLKIGAKVLKYKGFQRNQYVIILKKKSGNYTTLFKRFK